ncbi:MAG TPA: hypothetical protein VK763_11040 [Terriglobales bacterium]|jgi:hypothetical protein|nr:hypothetical protein [Terriglobales bacterium]
MKAFIAALLLSLALTGCSSNSSSSPQPTSPSQPNAPTTSSAFNAGGASAGFHGSIAKQTTAYKFSFLPTVYARTTVTLSGTYSGYAGAEEGAEFEGFGNPISQGSVPLAYPIYGVGTYNNNCGFGDPTQCLDGTATGSTDPGQALASMFNLTNATNLNLATAPVTGPGTLGPLVVYGYPENLAVPPPPLGTDVIEVWVIRNGQVLNSGITCSLQVQTGANFSQQRCESSSTFAIQDGDGIIATITVNPADYVLALTFLLVKS